MQCPCRDRRIEELAPGMNVRGGACSVSKTQPRTGGNGICVGRGADGTRHGEKMLGLVLHGRRCAWRESVSGCGGGVVMASSHEVVVGCWRVLPPAGHTTGDLAAAEGRGRMQRVGT